MNGVFTKCEGCGQPIYEKELKARFNVCPHCQFHFPLSAPERVRLLADRGSFSERDAGMTAGDPSGSRTTGEKLEGAREKDRPRRRGVERGGEGRGAPGSARGDGLSVHRGEHGERGGREDHPHRRGGPRGRAAARDRLGLRRGADVRGHLLADADGEDQRGPLALRDRLVALRLGPDRPDVRGGDGLVRDRGGRRDRRTGRQDRLRGARVIESTTKERLPEGFQTAEFQKEHGLVDRIVHRLELKSDLERFLGFLT